MIEEAIDTIENLSLRASEVKIQNVPGDPRKLIVSQNGSHEERDVPPAIREHAIERIEDLASYVTLVSGRSSPAGSPSFWHSDDKISALIDDGDRRDTAEMELVHSPQFTKLLSLPGKFDQRALIKLLKVDFDGCLDNPPIVEVFREVKFRAGTMAAGQVQHGRESLGREIEGEVTGAGALPEEISVTVTVYRNPDLDQFTATVRLAVDVDYGENKFILTPFPDELHNAQQFLHDQIRELLKKNLPEGTPIVHGTP